MKNFVKTYLIITIGLISQLTFAQKAEFIPTMLREDNFAIREIANKVTPFG